MLNQTPAPFDQWFWLVGIALGSSGLTAVVNGWLNRRKVRAESSLAETRASQTRVDSDLAITKEWRTYAATLEQSIQRMNLRVDALELERDRLQTDLRAALVRLDELSMANRELARELALVRNDMPVD